MKKVLDNFEEYVIGILFVVCTAVVIFQAIIKFIIPSMAAVTAELSQYIYEYIAFFGIGYCMKWGVDLSIDLFGTFTAGTVFEKIFKQFNRFLYVVVYAILLFGAVQATAGVIGVTAKNSGIPMAPVYVSAIGGFALGLIRWVQTNLCNKTTWKENK